MGGWGGDLNVESGDVACRDDLEAKERERDGSQNKDAPAGS